MSVNQITLIGNVGKDIKIAGTESNPIANFSVATEYSYKNRDGSRVSETDWHRVVAFGQTAKFISNYAKTGRQVYVQGRLRTRKYDKDGSAHYVTEIVAETFNLLGANPDRDDSRCPAPKASPAPHDADYPRQAPGFSPPDRDDDIPF